MTFQADPHRRHNIHDCYSILEMTKPRSVILPNFPCWKAAGMTSELSLDALVALFLITPRCGSEVGKAFELLASQQQSSCGLQSSQVFFSRRENDNNSNPVINHFMQSILASVLSDDSLCLGNCGIQFEFQHLQGLSFGRDQRDLVSIFHHT